VTARERNLEAPHKRIEGPPRLLERTAVLAYRAGSAVMALTPAAISRPILSVAFQGSYMLWPTKRRWSNANFGHVLGLPPDDPRVRALALRAYRAYARYVVELMRLPARAAKDPTQLEMAGVEELAATWRASGKPLIVTVAHVGNNEVCAAAIAHHGYPVSVVADDSAFPELFELLRAQRRSWGVELIPWRNLRALFDVLRRGEILGLLVDWGYRADGIPVRLFDAWTTLPAGPATLAAKSGAVIVPILQERVGDGFRLVADAAIHVASSEPAELQRATQAIADALQREIAAAPEQWYSFKPLWPLDPAEQPVLAQRAAEMRAGMGRRRVRRDGPAPEPATTSTPTPVSSTNPPATAADA
jgi:KDO2-lipid IV(A) lauroyltransferase